MKFLQRLLCLHEYERTVSISRKAVVAAKLGMTTWVCRQCGNEVLREVWERPIIRITNG